MAAMKMVGSDFLIRKHDWPGSSGSTTKFMMRPHSPQATSSQRLGILGKINGDQFLGHVARWLWLKNSRLKCQKHFWNYTAVQNSSYLVLPYPCSSQDTDPHHRQKALTHSLPSPFAFTSIFSNKFPTYLILS